MEARTCCYWDVRTWTSFIAWVHVAASSVGIVWLSILTTTEDYGGDKLISYQRVALMECLIGLLTGVILLGGIAMEKTFLMWAWIFIESLVTVVVLLFRLHEAASIGALALFPSVIGVPIFCFNMWIVRTRIYEITEEREVARTSEFERRQEEDYHVV